jgi:hypothetical protein
MWTFISNILSPLIALATVAGQGLYERYSAFRMVTVTAWRNYEVATLNRRKL